MNCLHSFRTEQKNELHKKAYENKNFCNVIMSSEDAETLKFNQY